MSLLKRTSICLVFVPLALMCAVLAGFYMYPHIFPKLEVKDEPMPVRIDQNALKVIQSESVNQATPVKIQGSYNK